MKEQLAVAMFDLVMEISKSSTTLILLVFLIVTFVIVIDSLFAHSQAKRREVGLDQRAVTVGVDGLKGLPARTYVSEIQSLAGRPDAVIKEGGYLIPVERKPLAKKIRDRYVAQLLVYMRLIEEFEGRKPPYGYLILGPSCKRVKIYNTAEKQAWLQKLLDEMQNILQGAPARPAPDAKKCRKCSVKAHCSARFRAIPEAASKNTLKILH